MNSFFDSGRRRVLAATWPLARLAWPLVAWPARAAPGAQQAVARFDAAVWDDLLREGPRPAAYVFAATWCSACPQVFAALRAHLAATRRRAALAAVLMDAQGAQALAHARRYGTLDRVFAFDGSAPAIRHAVDPTWRNIAPYVVLLDRGGRRHSGIGLPDARHLRLWLE